MATQAQIFANQENAQKSCGATSEAGREASSKNRTSHGLCYHSGVFTLLVDEDPAKFRQLTEALNAEHQPQTESERIIVRHMVQHEWLRARALRLQNLYFTPGEGAISEKRFALFIRYETTHERGFFTCLRELQNLRKEARKTGIGFESQKLKQAAEQRAGETLELKKQVFEWQKEVVQMKKDRTKVTANPKSEPEFTPAEQKMAA
jgi:hypothetical protein